MYNKVPDILCTDLKQLFQSLIGNVQPQHFRHSNSHYPLILHFFKFFYKKSVGLFCPNLSFSLILRHFSKGSNNASRLLFLFIFSLSLLFLILRTFKYFICQPIVNWLNPNNNLYHPVGADFL